MTDADREQAVARLCAAASEGRLTYGELVERTGRVGVTTAREELESLAANIPARAHRPAGPAKRWLVAVIGDEVLGGRWVAPGRLNAVAVLGDVTVDLRAAELRSAEISVHATALVGDVHVLVPRGATVELSVVSVIGAKKLRVEPVDQLPPVPVVRVSGMAVVGDVVVANDPSGSLVHSLKRRWNHRGTSDAS